MRKTAIFHGFAAVLFIPVIRIIAVIQRNQIRSNAFSYCTFYCDFRFAGKEVATAIAQINHHLYIYYFTIIFRGFLRLRARRVVVGYGVIEKKVALSQGWCT